MDVDNNAGAAVVGTPKTTRVNGTLIDVGSVYVYCKIGGVWSEFSIIQPPHSQSIANGKFGESVAINKASGRNDVTIAIGEPGFANVHIYVMENGCSSQSVTFQKTLNVTFSDFDQDGFGSENGIDVYHDIAIVGIPKHETVMIFHRLFVSDGFWDWDNGTILHSSDYDYDVILGVTHLHEHSFGDSVSISGRTIAIGAPNANGNEIGTEFVDSFDTRSNQGVGRGRVYIFYNTPHQQTITLKGDQEQILGTFKLELTHRNMTKQTEEIPYSASESELKSLLEGIENIDQVEVSTSSTSTGSEFHFIWTVSFVTDLEDPPLFVPLWKGMGCPNCTEFSYNYSVNFKEQLTVHLQNYMGNWEEDQYVEASDRRHGEGFGKSISLDGDYIAVGSPTSGSLTTTTWDFETGDLIGWTITGDAFDFQPTFGDNTRFRTVYGGFGDEYSAGAGVVSNLKGRYFIGTYEKRPGNGVNDYMSPHPSYIPGSIQGDDPTGTMTSQIFIILGNEISFLIGGGCDHRKQFVELIVDGVGVSRATGMCNEKMEIVTWNVSLFQNRAAQIKIVDDSTSNFWSHINVDHFTFDWNIQGAAIPQPTGLDDIARSLQHITHMIETPQSGAVYVYRRMNSENGDELCVGDILSCEWREINKIMASNKRRESQFGFSVSLDDSSGLLAVGAPFSDLTGFFMEVPTYFPYESGFPLDFPIHPNFMEDMMMDGTFGYQRSGAKGIWREMSQDNIPPPNSKTYYQSGSVYLYHRQDEERDGSGTLLNPVVWHVAETDHLQPPDIAARDHFGYSVALSDYSLLIGSVGHDLMGVDAGAVYSYDVHGSGVYFDNEEFVALEGSDLTIAIPVSRSDTTYPLTIFYSTSDLTAIAVDDIKYEDCLLQPLNTRTSDCGDYRQTSGELFFDEGVSEASFYVDIMNNPCYEHFSEHLQLFLSIPGNYPNLGGQYFAKIRIDDDDFQSQTC